MMTASPARRCRIVSIIRTAVVVPATLSALVLTGCATSHHKSAHHHSHHKAPVPQVIAKKKKFSKPDDGLQCPAEWESAAELQDDLWDRLQNNYQLTSDADKNNPRIASERDWYANHQAYLDRMSWRAERYLYYVTSELERRKLPGELALLPIVESAYNPFAYSRSDASGLWQFIPGTAKHLGMQMNWWYDERRDVVAATNSALDYLTFLRDHYNGDWLKAIAAYNAGWGTVDKAVARNQAKGLPTDFWSLDVPAETKAYVPKLLALAQISQAPDDYGVHWAYIPDLPYFASVNIDGQIDVARAADLAGISSDELYQLNPGISRWATPPGSQFSLLVPVDQVSTFQERIAELKQEDRLQFATYTVQKGDTVASIANRYHTSADMIQSVNGLKPKQAVSAGTTLRLPVADRSVPTLALNRTPATDPLLVNPGVKAIEEKIAATKKIASSPRTVKVGKGDTWASVAKKQGISVAELQKANHASPKDPLRLGETLAVPLAAGSKHADSKTEKTTVIAQTGNPAKAGGKAESASGKDNAKDKPTTAKTAAGKSTAQTTASADKAAAKQKKTAYTVQSGDTLVRIAKKHNLAVDDIARWNAIDKNHYSLQPGQMLTLYTVASKSL